VLYLTWAATKGVGSTSLFISRALNRMELGVRSKFHNLLKKRWITSHYTTTTQIDTDT